LAGSFRADAEATVRVQGVMGAPALPAIALSAVA